MVCCHRFHRLYKSQISQITTLHVTRLPLVLYFPFSNFYKLSIHNYKLLTSFSNNNTSFIRSITLFPSSLFLILKIFYIFKSSTKGIIFSILIWWPLLYIIPKAFLSSSAVYYNYIIAKILSLREIMSFCSRCAKKGLIYITIALPTSYQPLLYAKCTKSNMRSSCDVLSTFDTEYILFISLCNLLVLYLICYKVLYLNSY